MKIYISPSDQWSNTVADKAHSEAYHCTKIAEYARRYLKLNGYEVKVGDNTKEKTYSKRVTESNNWGADLHICIHTNAGGAKGTEGFAYPSSINNKYVKNIYAEVAKATPTADRGLKTNTTLYEIKHTKAVCSYIECEFHDNKTTENWIDNNLETLGKAFAKGVCKADNKTFKTGTVTQTNTTKNKLYKVQVGAFKSKENADNYAKELEKDGFSTYVVKSGSLYKVQVGAFASRENAENYAKKLEAKDYPTYIIQTNA